MKKTTRMLSLLVALTVCIGLLGACGGDKASDSNGGNGAETTTTEGKNEAASSGDSNSAADDVITELTLPLCENKEEISVWTFWGNSDRLDSPNDVTGVQEMERRTNVHVNWNFVTTSEASEKFSLMLASGDVPDIVYMAMATATQGYTGGFEKAVSDGVFLDPTPIIEKYMPNYRKILEDYPEANIDSTTDTGMKVLYSMSASDAGPQGENEWCGYVIRQDWLDDLGLAKPETIDEWHTVLTAFKEQKGCEAPLMIGPSGPAGNGAFLTAYGVLPGFYQENGTVKFGPAEEGYKEYIELMAQWYKEGLIDPNFISSSASIFTPNEYAATGRAGAFMTLYGMSMDAYVNMGMAEPGFYLSPIANPVLNKGETPKTVHIADTIVNSQIGISANTKNVELVAKWLDYQYSKEGADLNLYGVEGETYTVADDGSYQFTDLILNNPDGNSAKDALKYYARGNGLGLYNWQTAMRTYPNYDDIVAVESVWTDCDMSLSLSKHTTMTEEEGNEYNAAYTAVSTMVSEQATRWIQGQETTDNWDQYVADLNQYGLDTCIKIQQAALDRYNNRSK